MYSGSNNDIKNLNLIYNEIINEIEQYCINKIILNKDNDLQKKLIIGSNYIAVNIMDGIFTNFKKYI